MNRSAATLRKALKRSYFCRAFLLMVWSAFLVTTPAFAQKFTCNDYFLEDTGQELPESMWRDIGYHLTIDMSVRAGTRDAVCAMSGDSVKRGAPYQAKHFCYVGCNPLSVWEEGPFYYCEKLWDATAYYAQYHYRNIGLGAKHRCAETTAQLSGPKRIPSDLEGLEQGIDLKLRLSDHARYFSSLSFLVDTAKLVISSDSPGADNRLSDYKLDYLSFPPPIGGWYRVDDNGEFNFKLLPQKYFLSRPVKRQTITVKATCSWCQNIATWDIQVGPPDIVIGFFNGVANTRDATQSSIDRLEVEFGPQYKDAPLKYEWFYNQTACGEGILGKPSCLEDVAEVFDQRTRELGGVFATRWETFWDILAGRHQQETSLTGRLVDLLGNGGNALLQWLDTGVNAILNQIARDSLKLITLFKDSPTYENRANHMERLWQHADENSGMVLVAHSQGNLFVNSAYDALKTVKPNAQAKVVHVAPASPTLRGEYVLANIDLVINALRVTGLNSVPDVNISLPLSKIDPSGHGFEPTYLDTTRSAYARTRSLIVQSLDALVD